MKRTHLPLNALRVFDAAARHLSFTRAADDIFIGSAGIFLLLIGLIWLTKRPPRAAGGGAVDAGGAH